MRTISSENWRFWLPVLGLAVLTVYSSANLILAHVDPEVHAPNYDIKIDLKARRGSIYGSYGRETPFVKSVPCWKYYLDPVALTNVVVKRKGEPQRPKLAILKTISDALKFDYGKLKEMSEFRGKQYRCQYLDCSFDRDVHDILANSRLVGGIAIKDTYERQYLRGRSMSHILGALTVDGKGLSGLELKYNRELTGLDGRIKGKKDARGRELYDKREISIDARPGADIYLTIDPNIQFEVEEQLKWGMEEYGADSGWAIVMDVETGAIYAMASYPDYDPSDYGAASESARLNRAIGFNFEPGSVMKVLTVAAAIDSNPHRFGPQTRYRTNRDDSDYYKLPGDGSHVWEPTMTLTEAIVHSSNIVIGKLAYDLGPLTLYKYFKDFGLGAKTGIELPGEQYGILPDPNKKMWDLASRSRAGIGQFVAVTPIQLISAYQAIANNGLRMKPYLVDRIVDADGKIVMKNEPQELGRPIRAETASVVRQMMVDVASREGTARRAAIRGFSVAGKTGTAQKADRGHYLPGLYRASFCGMVPAGDPKIVILTSLDFDKKTLYHQGGNSAGPVFKRIALATIRYLGIPPDRPEELESFESQDEFDKILDERAAKYML